MKALALRTCKRNAAGQLESSNGFIWPESGEAICTDWIPSKECGNGLHACLWGEGDGSLLNWNSNAVWMVLEIEDWIDLKGKVKFEKANVLFCGNKYDATSFIINNGAQGNAVIGATITGGDGATITGAYGATITGGHRATLTGGYGATLTGGDRATLTGGYGATLTGGYGATLTGAYGATITGGDRATLIGGERATLTGGDGATLTGGERATLTGGDGATLTGGDGATLTGGGWATLTGGYGATLTGGYGATLIGGDRATLIGGERATLTGGDLATLTVKIWDGNYYRLYTAYVGENGILPNVPYQFDKNSKQFKPKQI